MNTAIISQRAIVFDTLEITTMVGDLLSEIGCRIGDQARMMRHCVLRVKKPKSITLTANITSTP
ncbi:hypothetical protein [Methylomonas methanica]|uniref:Uncharacterized protein n=1 Tax=Methylomonas methanica (strain DSM 25384 / MC09) TaxID=857087 RepID=G0A6Q0_METMM|nr:hypothetical protein [Methylomonas methanica]AEG00521.1 hypothetical protein Metme_2116 [Methylomonas methanica MC09]